MKLKLTCYVRRTEQLKHSPVGNTGHFIVWLVPHNVVNKLKIWFGSTITGNSFTSSHLKKTCVTAIHLLRSLHFIIKFVQLLWNSTKFYKTVGTFCAAKQKTYNIQQFRKSVYKPVNQYSILNFFIRIHCTHKSSTRGSLNVEALYPGRNRPLYPDRSISVCVVSPYVFIIAILTVPLSSDSSQGSFTTIAPLATALWLQNWNGED